MELKKRKTLVALWITPLFKNTYTFLVLGLKKWLRFREYYCPCRHRNPVQTLGVLEGEYVKEEKVGSGRNLYHINIFPGQAESFEVCGTHLLLSAPSLRL